MKHFYVGTFTKLGGEGILDCTIENEKIVCRRVIKEIENPSYVILSSDRKKLYAVCSDVRDAEYPGGVCSYNVGENGVVLLHRKASLGEGICHISLSSDECHLYGAHYGSGSVCVMETSPELKNAKQVIPHGEVGHVHQITQIPGSDDMLAVDLGQNRIIRYARNPQTGILEQKSVFQTHGGIRHLDYAGNGSFYASHEISNEISFFRMHADGKIECMQTVSSLPEGFSGESYAGAIRYSEKERKVYVSNRGHGSIAVFRTDLNGMLSLERFIPAGIFPRDFRLLENGCFLIADQKAGVIYSDHDGKRLDFYPQLGAVCICI